MPDFLLRPFGSAYVAVGGASSTPRRSIDLVLVNNAIGRLARARAFRPTLRFHPARRL
jgi:hypothetical protein